jgi:hypothetical protein
MSVDSFHFISFHSRNVMKHMINYDYDYDYDYDLSHRSSVGTEGRHSFLAAADTAAAALLLLLGLLKLIHQVAAAALLLLLGLHELLQRVASTLARPAMMLRPRLALRLIMLPVGLLSDLQDLLE